MAKSEKVPNVDSGMNEDGGVIRIQYSNGPQHYYDKDIDGKKTHISEDKMLELYGYADSEPDQPLTVARPEDYVDPVDPAEPEPTPEPSSSARPGEVGAVKTDRSPVPDAEDDEFDLDDEDLDNDFEDDEELLDPEDLLEAERERTAKVAKLEADLQDMTEFAAAFESTGDKDKLDKARAKFMEMFSTLAELKGWDDTERDAAFDAYVSLAERIIANNEKLSNLKVELDKARDNLARLNVAASGRIIKTSKMSAELEAANVEWERLVAQAGALSMEIVLLEGGDMDAKALRTLTLAQAQNQSKELNEAQALASERGPDGNWLKKFTHKRMQGYHKAGRFGKMWRMLLPGLIVGVSAGTIIGALGGGIAAGLVARGATRGLLNAKMKALQEKNGKDVTEVFLADVDIAAAELDESARAELMALKAANASRRASEIGVSENIRGNRKTARKAIALGALVGAASGIAANILTDQHWGKGSGVGGKATKLDPFDGQRPGGSSSIPESLPGGGGGGNVINPIEYAGNQGIDLGARDAWPFKIANQLGLSEQDSIALAEKSGFTFREGKYWIGNRMMNYEEMKMHNLSLADIAARRAAGNTV